MTLEKLGGGGVIVEAEGPLGAPEGSWIDVASLPTARSGLAAASDGNGLVYAIGGRSSNTLNEATVEQYDPNTDTWVQVASLNTGRRAGLAAASDGNGLVYAIGGLSSSSDYESSVEQYDPSGNTWTVVASLNTGRRSFDAASDNDGFVYAIGGRSSSDSYEPSVEKYDPSGNTWSTVASLNTGRETHAAASDNNGNIYAIGGENDFGIEETSVEKYDPSSNTWTTVASPFSDRDDVKKNLAAASDSNGLVYAIGGESGNNTYENSVEQYDPSSDTWTTVESLNTGRRALAAALDSNGNVCAIGGISSAGREASVEQLTSSNSFADVFSANGDALVNLDDPNGILKNRTTGEEVTDRPLIARDGQTIAAVTGNPARVYRTEEI